MSAKGASSTKATTASATLAKTTVKVDEAGFRD